MKHNIYVVEDDTDIAELLYFNLEKEGFKVKTEKNGDKAFDEILKKTPDLLILDLNLPGLSGIEICKYLRENARTKDLPIIMLTARTQAFRAALRTYPELREKIDACDRRFV